jgi:hypothetical protein
VTYTTINRVSNPSQGLITKSNNSIKTLVSRYAQEQLRSIASTKDLVHCCKVSCPLIRIKVWCKNAPFYTLFPEELAGTTRPTPIICTSTHHLLSAEIIHFLGVSVSLFVGSN